MKTALMRRGLLEEISMKTALMGRGLLAEILMKTALMGGSLKRSALAGRGVAIQAMARKPTLESRMSTNGIG